MIAYVCDFCEKPLHIGTLYTDHGAEDHVDNYRTLELDTRKAFPHLCRDCANKLDGVLSFAKVEWLKQIDISDRNSRINAARKELLGTKG